MEILRLIVTKAAVKNVKCFLRLCSETKVSIHSYNMGFVMRLNEIDFCDKFGYELSIGDTIEWYSKNAKRFRQGKLLRVTIRKTPNRRYGILNGKYQYYDVPSVLRCTFHVSGGIVLSNKKNIKIVSVASSS